MSEDANVESRPKFAEKVTRSGRDLEDPNLAEFEFKKLQEGVRREAKGASSGSCP
jgi:hypothetical protein